MKTVSEIRRENLESLVNDLGSLDAVAFTGQTSSIYLSQVRHQSIDQKTGKPRQMGNAVARRLDKGNSKPEGWMDKDHAQSSTTPTAQIVPLVPAGAGRGAMNLDDTLQSLARHLSAAGHPDAVAGLMLSLVKTPNDPALLSALKTVLEAFTQANQMQA